VPPTKKGMKHFIKEVRGGDVLASNKTSSGERNAKEKNTIGGHGNREDNPPKGKTATVNGKKKGNGNGSPMG